MPDLPACVSNGRTLEVTGRNIEVAIAGHLAVMRGHKEAIPQATTEAGYIEVTDVA